MTLNHSNKIPLGKRNKFFIIVESESDSDMSEKNFSVINYDFQTYVDYKLFLLCLFYRERDNVIKANEKKVQFELNTVWTMSQCYFWIKTPLT